MAPRHVATARQMATRKRPSPLGFACVTSPQASRRLTYATCRRHRIARHHATNAAEMPARSPPAAKVF